MICIEALRIPCYFRWSRALCLTIWLVTAIKESPAWTQGQNAIVVLWDENDYSVAPNVNKVLLIVDTNYGTHGIQSATPYNHFSLLKSIEAGLGLPCLNHACDDDVKVMRDLFGHDHD